MGKVQSKPNHNVRIEKLPEEDFDVNCLTLYACPFPKFRVGRNEDGGYVIAELQRNAYDLFLAGGVGGDISFELDFCKYYPGVQCNLFDGTVDHLPKGQQKNPNIHFFKKNIGPVETDKETNWYHYLDRYQNIFLKMDIESGEYPWIESLSDEQLSRFSQMVIEFHWPKNKRHQRVFEKLNRTHYLVHFHGNNCEPFAMMGQTLVPRVFECTYVNKKYFRSPPGLNRTKLPTVLDYPNGTDLPDLQMDYKPFVF